MFVELEPTHCIEKFHTMLNLPMTLIPYKIFALCIVVLVFEYN